jgi:hypothetical protein
MTQDDIIAMAREAGLIVVTGVDVGPGTSSGRVLMWPISVRMGSSGVKEIERLVELARADEREACAKVCDKYAEYSCNPSNFAEQCADAIRARGQA